MQNQSPAPDHPPMVLAVPIPEVSSTGPHYVEWSWDPVENALAYQVEVADSMGRLDGSEVQLVTDTMHRVSVKPESEMFIRVRAAAGTPTSPIVSDWSDPVKGMSVTATHAPGVPVMDVASGHEEPVPGRQVGQPVNERGWFHPIPHSKSGAWRFGLKLPEGIRAEVIVCDRGQGLGVYSLLLESDSANLESSPFTSDRAGDLIRTAFDGALKRAVVGNAPMTQEGNGEGDTGTAPEDVQ